MSPKAKRQRRKKATMGANTPAAAPASVPQNREGISAAGPWSWREWGLTLLLVASVVIAYQPVWRAGFIWDDDHHLAGNPCIVGPLGFAAIWTSPAAVYYPLVLSSFWLQHAMWGLDPVPYHLVNIAMHAACAILLWRTLLSLGVRGAWLGAALWVLHPVMVESAAWITEQKNTQSCLFYLLAILFFLRWWKGYSAPAGQKAGGAFYTIALLCGTLSILSKSSTVMLPVVLGLCAWWMGDKRLHRTSLLLVPFLLVSVVASAWTVWEQKFHTHSVGPLWDQSIPERLIIAGNAIWFYLGKLAWPQPLLFFYPRWNINASQPLAWIPLIAAAAGLFLLWRGRNGRMRPLFFATAYFVTSLFPVLGFFSIYFFRYSFVADHFQYLASMSPLALAAAGLENLWDRWLKRRALPATAFCTVLLGFLGALTWSQSRNYRDIEALWRATIASNPECWVAHTNLGAALFQRGRADDAIAQYREALRINPSDSNAHCDLGIALNQQGRLDEAADQFRDALATDPTLAPAHIGLGAILLDKGRIADAVAQYRDAVQIDPTYQIAQSNLGIALLRLGNPAEALDHMERALALQPGNPHTQNALAWMLAATLPPALRDGLRAVQLATEATQATGGDQPVTLRTLAAAYAQAGQFPAAIETAQKALELAVAQANTALADLLRREIKLYQAGRQYQDSR
jgi:tetratricopeptide (TPR) repeat protein